MKPGRSGIQGSDHIRIESPLPNIMHAALEMSNSRRHSHSLSLHSSPQSQQIEDGEVTCALLSDLVKPVFTFSNLNKNGDSFSTVFIETDADQFTLVFANCFGNQLKVSMDVRSAMYNLDGKSQWRDYLSVGKTILPRVYFLLSLGYFFLAELWISVLYKKQLTMFRIHFFMLTVLIFKALNLLCEAEDKSYIKRTGSAHGWDVLFYIFSFLKGITLFTLIVLIRTGWSFLKPYLQDKEKKVLMIVFLYRLWRI
ncbi:protein CANDIDATE G-PROTEIN COUPLED RECEPTOR 7-like [Quercus robur]|uniref:protein CANDIDATE G-PROTEIN COUPLED RECEPTOR 7-like n=1 Tax=Quercus robur TaxID=38942 RepID=UPI0021617B4E|nr:protein CANDIDATE G-PROTEIN COUPLED RECEPTOR 7-like [Quercus robur]